MFVETGADPLKEIPVSPAIPERDGILRILREARELIARPYGWIKYDFKRSRLINGNTVTGYCMLGAIGRAEGSAYAPETRTGRFACSVLEQVIGGDVPQFNDSRSGLKAKSQVLTAFDRAIAHVEEH